MLLLALFIFLFKIDSYNACNNHVVDPSKIVKDTLLDKLPKWGPSFNISLELFISSFTPKHGSLL